MLELQESIDARHGRAVHYLGPERRGASLPAHQRMALMLDEIDYAMLLLADESHVAHINKAARRELDAEHPLQLLGQELRARHGHDVLGLREALVAAHQRGLRRLLQLGSGDERVSVAVTPLSRGADDAGHNVLLVLGKRQVCEELSVDGFARSQGLTPTETQVLKALCEDLTPQEIAVRQGVGLATVRTQIGSIRSKTGAASIRALVRQVALLPPLVSALHATPPSPAHFDDCAARAACAA